MYFTRLGERSGRKRGEIIEQATMHKTVASTHALKQDTGRSIVQKMPCLPGPRIAQRAVTSSQAV
jgi:hypothetical protein